MVDARVLRIGLTSLLLAAVFLGSVIPPAVQHAHEGHDQNPTSSVTSQDVSHTHTHQHPHHHSAQPSTDEEFPNRHIHLSVFGWDVTWPSGNMPHESLPGSKSLCGPGEYLVRLVDGDSILVAVHVVEWLKFDLPCFTCCVNTARHIATPSFDANPPDSPLLCDRARGERSGVQLI